MTSDVYVTNQAWVRTVGRPDAIDEVADAFERPAVVVAAAPTGGVPRRGAHWPLRSRGWRTSRQPARSVREPA